MTILSLLIKASVLVALVAAAQSAIGRRTSAATRHLVWVLTIAGLLLLPVLSSVLPGWRAVSPVPVQEPAAIASASTVTASPLPAGGPVSTEVPMDVTIPW